MQGVGLPNGKGEKTTVVLIDEAGNEIVEQITNNEDRQAFTKKYGLQLPPPPPPPPSAIRVKKAEELPPPPAPPTPVGKMKKSTELPPPPPPPVPVKEK
ncbi:hypothetical protein QIU18_12250 [Capnocytophaga canimorsus]|nr:hypothetical protein [Capnocytophaga canimorsus]WGU68655.1 hypothetical protein QIU19_01320 [Capnocytophaga canimorsus]WGU70233.1 hypothetical protein QIU18_12250 [Capnocytophaga canimorsus]